MSASAVVDPRFGPGFRRKMGFVSFFLSFLAALLSYPGNLELFGFPFVLLASVLGPGACMGGAAALALVYSYSTAGMPENEGLLFTLASSSWALGGSLTTMLLGHSYLSAGNLSFQLLIDSCVTLLLSLLVRAVVAAALFLPRMNQWEDWTDRDMILGLLVVVRFLAGLILAAILAGMALQCARLRSNRSATGILYVVAVFVLVGEAVSVYSALERKVLL